MQLNTHTFIACCDVWPWQCKQGSRCRRC